jgi:hypothetical protein
VAGGDWDADLEKPDRTKRSDGTTSRKSTQGDLGDVPNIEEILRSWARDPAGFASADQKVTAYLAELERRANESGSAADAKILKKFRETWDTLARELR